MATTETLNQELYNELHARGYEPVSLDTSGKPSNEIEKADIFKILVNRRKQQFNAWVTIQNDSLVIYIDDNVIKSSEFTDLNEFLKQWKQNKPSLQYFKIMNTDHLKYDMAKRSKEKMDTISEGYMPLGKKASMNDAIPQVKMIIQHTRPIEENEQRFRNVARIFVENTNGERFLLPTRRPGLAKVYARHIAEGGTPYDERGKHITSLVEEYTKMAGFVRATRNAKFNESALKLVNEGLKHYGDLKMNLHSMISHRGYHKYFESYTPVLNEQSDDTASLNELFVRETLDPRIESVLPILSRLNKNLAEDTTVKNLDEWAKSLTDVLKAPSDDLTEASLSLADERREKFLVLKGDRNNRENPPVVVGTWDGERFETFDRTKYRSGDRYPPGTFVSREEGPQTDKSLALSKLKETSNDLRSNVIKAISNKHPEWLNTYGADHIGEILDELFDTLPKIKDVATLTVQDYIDKVKSRLTTNENKQIDEEQEYYSLEKKLDDADIYQRIDAASKITDEKHFMKAITDDSSAVRMYAVENPNCPVSCLLMATRDPNKKISAAAKKKLAKKKKSFFNLEEQTKEVSENISKRQKKVGQLGPTERAKKISPVLGKKSKQHPFKGKLVGASESKSRHSK